MINNLGFILLCYLGYLWNILNYLLSVLSEMVYFIILWVMFNEFGFAICDLFRGDDFSSSAPGWETWDFSHQTLICMGVSLILMVDILYYIAILPLMLCIEDDPHQLGRLNHTWCLQSFFIVDLPESSLFKKYGAFGAYVMFFGRQTPDNVVEEHPTFYYLLLSGFVGHENMRIRGWFDQQNHN